MLGVNLIHGDFEHIVATNADTMDFHRGLFAGLGGGVFGVVSLLSFAHRGILSRSEYCEIGSGGFDRAIHRNRTG